MKCTVRNSKGTRCTETARYRLVVDYGCGEEVVEICNGHMEEQRRLLGRFIKSESLVGNQEREVTS